MVMKIVVPASRSSFSMASVSWIGKARERTRPCRGIAGGAGSVHGQGERRRDSREALAPILQRPLHALRSQPTLLPGRVVPILNGQRRQRIRLPADHGAIQGGNLPGEDPGRPAIENQMVGDEKESVVATGVSQQYRTGQGTGFQVDGLSRPAPAEAVALSQPCGMAQGSEVDQGKNGRRRWTGPLHRPPTLLVEGDAKNFVARHHRRQGAAQGLDFQRSFQSQGPGNVVQRSLREPAGKRPTGVSGSGKEAAPPFLQNLNGRYLRFFPLPCLLSPQPLGESSDARKAGRG